MPSYYHGRVDLELVRKTINRNPSMANYTLKQMERPFDENLSLMSILDLCSEESSY